MATDNFIEGEKRREKRKVAPKKPKMSLGDMLREAKRNMKNGPAKNKIWAFICFGGCIALFIWWLFVLASF